MTERGSRDRGVPSRADPGGPQRHGASRGSRPDAPGGGEPAPDHLPPAAPRPYAGVVRAPAPPPARAPLGSASRGAAARRMRTDVGWRIADAYLALAALALVELAAVGVLFRREFAAAYEVVWALRDLLPLALAAAAPCAIAAGALVELVAGGARPLQRALSAAAAGGFAGAVAFGVSGGRLLQGGLRAPFVAAIALGAAGAGFALGPRLARALAAAEADPRPWGRARPAIAALGAALALELVNATVLPRLYPAFHLGLGALTLAVVPFATLSLRAEIAGRGASRLRRAALALVLFALGAAIAPGAAAHIAPADNVRLIYATRAPLLAHVVELAAALSPPPPLEDEPLAEQASGHALDLQGRDLLLVTVDALRADHVGAYGYERPTTPRLDQLAAEGVVFEAAYTPTPHTSYTIASLMTGKYVRPLLMQGLGEDSETWAQHLRRYGYRTAAFYPPAVFFIDGERFGELRGRGLDFEYRKVEFASAAARVEQVRGYLAGLAPGDRAFVWVHLFEPHEPY